MFSKELARVIAGVFTSWQTLAVTLCIVFYIALVLNVARLHRNGRSRPPRSERPKKAKKTKEPEETAEMDELGLED